MAAAMDETAAVEAAPALPMASEQPTPEEAAKIARREAWASITEALQERFGPEPIGKSAPKQAIIEAAFGSHNLAVIAKMPEDKFREAAGRVEQCTAAWLLAHELEDEGMAEAAREAEGE